MRVAFVVTACVGCGFHGGGAGEIDAAAGRDSGSGSGSSGSGSGSWIEAGTGAEAGTPAGECGGKRWIADFSTDPTQQDLNGDGIMDWALRTGGAFPTSQLSNGVWSAPSAGVVLDTQPKQPFTTRTIVHARMRGTTLGLATAHGAVFWINVGYQSDHTFAPLFIDAKLTTAVPANESLTVYTKTAVGQELSPSQFQASGDDFHDISLDIDPGNLTATYVHDGGTATAITLTRQNAAGLPDPGDQWASITPYSTGADFDSISVEVCP